MESNTTLHDQHALLVRSPDPACGANAHGMSVLQTVPGPSARNELSRRASLDHFFQSCGGTASLKLTVAESGKPQTAEARRFQQPFVLIGRAPECDLRLEHPEISRRHAYLQLVAGRWMCVDLASRNGVQWPGGGNQACGWLDSNGKLEIGPYQIRRCIDSESALPAVPALTSTAPDWNHSDVYLQFLNGRKRGRERTGWSIRHRITLVGSHETCKLRLKHASVSPFHASLVLTERGLWVVSLAGERDVLIDGEPVQWGHLEVGSELQVGRFRLRVQTGPELQPTANRAARVVPEAARPPTGAGISEEFVLGLVAQFAAMQQQFMAYSQQQTLVTTQLLESLHADARGSLREELESVQELSRELEALRGQLVRESTPPQPSLPASQDSASPPSTLTGGDSTTPRLGHLAQNAVLTAPESLPELVAVVTAAPPPVEEPQPEPVSEALVSPPLPTAADAQEESIESPPPSRPLGEAVASHTRLMERMATLERERTSRWTRILGTLMGRGG